MGSSVFSIKVSAEEWLTLTERAFSSKMFGEPGEKTEETRCKPITFQEGVSEWVERTFGDKGFPKTRSFRVLEEAIELAQANGVSESDVHILVSEIFNKPAGVSEQEVGGVLTTLAAYCCCSGLDLMQTGVKELERMFNNIEKIREKNKLKRHYGEEA